MQATLSKERVNGSMREDGRLEGRNPSGTTRESFRRSADGKRYSCNPHGTNTFKALPNVRVARKQRCSLLRVGGINNSCRSILGRCRFGKRVQRAQSKRKRSRTASGALIGSTLSRRFPRVDAAERGGIQPHRLERINPATFFLHFSCRVQVGCGVRYIIGEETVERDRQAYIRQAEAQVEPVERGYPQVRAKAREGTAGTSACRRDEAWTTCIKGATRRQRCERVQSQAPAPEDLRTVSTRAALSENVSKSMEPRRALAPDRRAACRSAIVTQRARGGARRNAYPAFSHILSTAGIDPALRSIVFETSIGPVIVQARWRRA